MATRLSLLQRSSFVAAVLLTSAAAYAKSPGNAIPNVSVGPQYDTTHVYIGDASHYDDFVNAFTATFGGKPSPRATANVMPVPANTQLQYVWSPVGTLSTFSFLTPIPYPFGQERTGWLVTDLDKALAAARASGAEVIVDKRPFAYGRRIRQDGDGWTRGDNHEHDIGIWCNRQAHSN